MVVVPRWTIRSTSSPISAMSSSSQRSLRSCLRAWRRFSRRASRRRRRSAAASTSSRSSSEHSSSDSPCISSSSLSRTTSLSSLSRTTRLSSPLSSSKPSSSSALSASAPSSSSPPDEAPLASTSGSRASPLPDPASCNACLGSVPASPHCSALLLSADVSRQIRTRRKRESPLRMLPLAEAVDRLKMSRSSACFFQRFCIKSCVWFLSLLLLTVTRGNTFDGATAELAGAAAPGASAVGEVGQRVGVGTADVDANNFARTPCALGGAGQEVDDALASSALLATAVPASASASSTGTATCAVGATSKESTVPGLGTDLMGSTTELAAASSGASAVDSGRLPADSGKASAATSCATLIELSSSLSSSTIRRRPRDLRNTILSRPSSSSSFAVFGALCCTSNRSGAGTLSFSFRGLGEGSTCSTLLAASSCFSAAGSFGASEASAAASASPAVGSAAGGAEEEAAEVAMPAGSALAAFAADASCGIRF
mmetsp:Transcript_77293/g.145758  ORF Transcript_77293/g.145758 Transcript_77293/m.145758 type:complete len:486 (+) Transcript_77293:345-1802(+)